MIPHRCAASVALAELCDRKVSDSSFGQVIGWSPHTTMGISEAATIHFVGEIMTGYAVSQLVVLLRSSAATASRACS